MTLPDDLREKAGCEASSRYEGHNESYVTFVEGAEWLHEKLRDQALQLGGLDKWISEVEAEKLALKAQADLLAEALKRAKLDMVMHLKTGGWYRLATSHVETALHRWKEYLDGK